MARGTNRAVRSGHILAKSATSIPSQTCVFISHQRADTEDCAKIADYLISAGLDVYFDKYDPQLAALVASGNANAVTQRIKNGINNSTHMLCVVSPFTIKSYWVPFEVGYGYDRRTLGVLTLKGIRDGDLPDYMKTTKVIRGTKSLNDFIAELLRSTRDSLEGRQIIAKAAAHGHPLDAVLDKS